MTKRAIKLDLSNFFEDERKMCYILLNSSWTNVECLQKRVEHLFEVDSIRFLGDGCFLPPQESIEIIKLCSDIKAFAAKQSTNKRKKFKKSKKSSENVDEGDKHQDSLQKERKSISLQNNDCSNISPCKPKRSKTEKSLLPISNIIDELTPQLLQNDVDNKISRTKKNFYVSNGYSKEVEEENVSCVVKSPIPVIKIFKCIEENAKSSDDHIRNEASISKENEISNITENNCEKSFNCEISAHPSNIPSATFLNENKLLEQCNMTHRSIKSSNPKESNNPFRKTNLKHIYFNESGGAVNSTPKRKKSTLNQDTKPKTIIMFRCPLNDVANNIQAQKPRIFHIKSQINLDSVENKTIVEIQNNIILTTGPMQKNINELSSNLQETATYDSTIQQETNESCQKIDFRRAKNVFDNTVVATETTSIAKNDKQEVISDDLKVSQKNEKNISEKENESELRPTNGNINQREIKSFNKTQNECEMDLRNVSKNVEAQNYSKIEQNNVDEKNMSVDYFDLSIIGDDENKVGDNGDEQHNSNEKDTSLESDIEEITEIIDLIESEENCSMANMKVNEILPFSTNLSELPKMEDIIIFKLPHSNKKIFATNFMVAKVEYINKRTKTIKVLIMDGFSELDHLPLQYIFYNMDNSLDHSKHLQLKLSDMIEAKLFSGF